MLIPRIDHRETSFGPQAFAAAYQFVNGKAPETTGFKPTATIVLNGQVTGQGATSNDPASGNMPNNLSTVTAKTSLFAIDSVAVTRLGDADKDAVSGNGAIAMLARPKGLL